MPEARVFRRAGRGKSASPVRRGESEAQPGCHSLSYSTGGALSTDGATYILQQAVRRALPASPTLKAKRISPHVIRHTTAMHLLQSGVEIAVIALWLGHESLDTTHMYIQADLKTKEQALGKLQPVEGCFPRFKPDDALLAFLSAL